MTYGINVVEQYDRFKKVLTCTFLDMAQLQIKDDTTLQMVLLM